MSSEPSAAWTLLQSAHTYAIDNWGGGYFSINAQGHVAVKPSPESDVELDLYAIAEALTAQGHSLPVLVRFTDILKDRVGQLHAAFKKAMLAEQYQGHYTPVYPIKVNQQRKVVEGILAADTIGLEAGSKPELLAILGLAKQMPGIESTVVCNGYKDRAYIRLALIGMQMGLNVFIVIEKPSELTLIIEESAKMQIKPQLGVRVRLSSLGAGKWQNSGGEKSKFGFHASDILQLLDDLRAVDLLDTLKLMHFHMGSQIANIHDIKMALKEAGQFYAQLHHLGAAIQVVDTGGGLGIDYDGSASRRDCSINYSLDEYAHNIVRSFSEVCAQLSLPQPNIITESGRAMTAHHAVLITNVTDIESIPELHANSELPFKQQKVVEQYHDGQFAVEEARSRFTQGELSLQALADAESHYLQLCRYTVERLNPEIHSHQKIMDELQEKLADKIFCNFSLFQSMPDSWAIDQIFPVMPIHRLAEKPDRRAVLQDLTCDSDGRINYYVDGQNIEKTMPLHSIDITQPYLIGFFLLGAYQEILGDMHNLFGDTHSINIRLGEDKTYHFSDFSEGEHVDELLDYVHIDSAELKQAYQQKLAQSALSDDQRQAYLHELTSGLTTYTYLEK
ncbi:MAG: biosynthetic arginine decarboxylase [Methylococcales bacterium]|nr:biosynthetic arginine decarboxylase [Methylococcales bacterium]